VAIYEPNRSPECPYPQAPDEESIFGNPEIKAVFICTPNYRTPELIQRALRAGKHVFSEKPPALNAKQMEQIREGGGLHQETLNSCMASTTGTTAASSA
jgi:1,5-anhydro-D-fructose reductase (1,5-anhydro-D-mannitol-forming)